MLKQKIFVAIMILLMVSTPLASASIFDEFDSQINSILSSIKDSISPLSFYGVSKVPVTITTGTKPGSTEEFYLIQGTIGTRSDAFQIVLPDETSIDIGNGKTIKNNKEVSVAISPQPPTHKTTLIQGTTIKYLSYNGITNSYTSPEYYEVQGGMWLTTAYYGVSIYTETNPSDLSTRTVYASQQVGVNYQQPQEIKLGDIYIENLGMLPNGLSVPSGSLVVVADPQGKYHLYDRSAFQSFVDGANNYFTTCINCAWGGLGSHSWNDIWNVGIQQNIIPRDYSLIGTASLSYAGKQANQKIDTITITLPTGSYSGQILVYIPTRVADSIIIVKQQSQARITSTSNIPAMNEGATATYQVSVLNVGSPDYIGVSMSCNNYQVQGGDRVYFNTGDDKTFTFRLTALGTIQDISTSCTILADGTAFSGGDDTKTVYGTIKNVMGKEVGFTPNPTPSPTPTGTPGNDDSQQPQDMTLLFWAAIFLVLGYTAYTTGWYRHPWFWIGLFLAYILYNIIQIMLGITASINEIASAPIAPWNWFK